MRKYNLTPQDLVNAINAGNAISPSGNLYVQGAMPLTPTNAMVREPKVFESIPLVPGRDVYVRDVATVSDATDLNYGYALVDGRKSLYVPIIKKNTASTLEVVSNVRKAMPVFKSVLPEDVDVSFAFDESPTVVTAVKNVATEGLIGAGLTGLMILLFLRDWRSVIVVVFNIPMALLGSLCGLWLTGNTINIMTLGGLALAIGILVDEATVEIENIHVQMGKLPSLSRASRPSRVAASPVSSSRGGPRSKRRSRSCAPQSSASVVIRATGRSAPSSARRVTRPPASKTRPANTSEPSSTSCCRRSRAIIE